MVRSRDDQPCSSSIQPASFPQPLDSNAALERSVYVRRRVHRRLPRPMGDGRPQALGRGTVLRLYPFTPLAIIDLLSVLPVPRPQRRVPYAAVLRLFRAALTSKLIRYSAGAPLPSPAFRKAAASALLAVLCLRHRLHPRDALVVFNVRRTPLSHVLRCGVLGGRLPRRFGYGDLYPSADVDFHRHDLSSLHGRRGHRPALGHRDRHAR